jgi:hypothetical protein
VQVATWSFPASPPLRTRKKQIRRLGRLKWGRELLLAALLIKIEEGLKPVDVVRHAPTKPRGRFSQFHPPTGRSDVRHARSKHRKEDQQTVFQFFTTPHRLSPLPLSIVVVLTSSCASADWQPPSSTISAVVTDHHGEEVDALVVRDRWHCRSRLRRKRVIRGPLISQSPLRQHQLPLFLSSGSPPYRSLLTRRPRILRGIMIMMMIPSLCCRPQCSDVKRGLYKSCSMSWHRRCRFAAVTKDKDSYSHVVAPQLRTRRTSHCCSRRRRQIVFLPIRKTGALI